MLKKTKTKTKLTTIKQLKTIKQTNNKQGQLRDTQNSGHYTY